MRTFFIRAVSITVYIFLVTVFTSKPYVFAEDKSEKKKKYDMSMFPPPVEPEDHWGKTLREDWLRSTGFTDNEDILMYEQTSGRYPKPIGKTAENLTVITRRQIERMNAHTVAEILDRVPGLFIQYTGQEMGSLSYISIQGSDKEHVLVLLDGVELNFLSSGLAETSTIPVGIIEKIEVIKGPGSAAWGSALGGVVNIITRTGGEDLDKPASSVSGTYGEENTMDFRATLTKKVNDKYGVFLHANRQSTDGIMPTNRGYEKNSFYLKLNTPVGDTTKMGILSGVTDSEINEPANTLGDTDGQNDLDLFWGKVFSDTQFNEKVSLNVSLFHAMQNFERTVTELSTGDFYYQDIFDDKTTGGTAQLLVKHGKWNSTVFGFDYADCRLDQSDQYLTDPIFTSQPGYDKYAFYINHTQDFLNLVIMPGIRYDYNDISKEFISPSLGITYQTNMDYILRMSIARGFSAPALTWISEGFWDIEPNPDLRREEVWSYQAGFETKTLGFMWIKSNYFYHDLHDEIVWSDFPFTPSNAGDEVRQGFDLELNTKPYYNIAFYAGGAFVYTDNKENPETTNIYAGNVGFKYNDRQTLRFELNGHFLNSDMDEDSYHEETDMLWDFSLAKTIKYWGAYHTEILFKVHNIFDGDQYFVNNDWNVNDKKNPHRWFEAGVSIKF